MMQHDNRERETVPGRPLIALLLLASTACGAVSVDRSGPATPTSPAEQLRVSLAALEDPNASERVQAVRFLRASAGRVPVALPALVRAADDADPAVRREARGAFVEHQDALVTLACSHDDPHIRTAAVLWIHAPAMILDVVMRAPLDTAQVAILRVEEPDRLVGLALGGPAALRMDAVQRLSALEALARVAHNGEERVAAAARARIVERLRSVEDLWKLYELAAGLQPELSSAAVAELGAQAQAAEPGRRAAALGRLVVLANSVPDEHRAAIMAHLGERSQILALARGGLDDTARALAELMPDDVDVQVALATHENAAIARMALEQNQDAKVLAAAAAHRDPAIRIAALERMQNTKQLIEALQREPSVQVQLAVTMRLDDKRALRQIARSARQSVIARLAKFLARQRKRGSKPVIALQVQGDRRLRKLVRQTTARLLGSGVLLFECESEKQCEQFATRVWVEGAVGESNQCFDRYHVYGECHRRGNLVVVSYSFHRDGELMAYETFESRTPSVVRGRGTAFTMYPTKSEVWRATNRKVQRDAREWMLSALDVSAFIAPSR